MTVPVTRLGPMCVVHGCMRPVRELGGYCTRHFQALSPLQRLSLQDDERWGIGKGDTEPLDVLELMYQLPSYGEAA